MKEQFALAASPRILAHLDAAADKAGLSRGQAFDDFLTFVRCALAGQTMEEEYLMTVRKGYDRGEQGERGIDQVTLAFAKLVEAMDETQQDVLGDLFTGAITYGERGQFFTPDSVVRLMAELTAPADSEEGPRTINDPACGSGRTLLAIGRDHPDWEFVGQDVDHRCAQMTAINLGLNGLRGWAVWQNTLSLECFRVYRIGLRLTNSGVISEVPVEQSPFNCAPGKWSGIASTPREAYPPAAKGPTNQLGLF
ncbi:MAG: N-6 DNA methylase [Planctomycetota bacterium]